MLRELRPWLVGGEELCSALWPICGLQRLTPGDWRGCRHEPAADFLLVEATSEAQAEWGEALDRLLETCGRRCVPRFLWFRGEVEGAFWLERLGRFERVFATKRGQLRELAERGVEEPGAMWAATALPAEGAAVAMGEERSIDVLWLGGWRPEWPAAWRERLASVLRGASRHGLTILPLSPVEGLPEDLWPFVCGARRSAGERAALLGQAKVAIGADAGGGGVAAAPQAIFDAAACGAAVVTPHEFAAPYDFALMRPGRPPLDLLPSVDGERRAEAEVGRLLGDMGLRDEVARHLRGAVAYNHTYAHRLAMLASAAGRRLLP